MFFCFSLRRVSSPLVPLPLLLGVLQRFPPLCPFFTGFPPFMFHVGSTELMRDDSTRLAEFMQAKGVDAHLQIWRQMPHVFPLFEQLPESKAALIQIIDFIKKHLK